MRHKDENLARQGMVLVLIFLLVVIGYQAEVLAQEGQKVKNRTNHLRGEKSPYLLQHATNPVDWYPWGKEAFARAKEADKPIFLSIGYSTCHWCHVMAHESFEDNEVARVLNDIFICIKVDREERPDIDHIYMDVCQMLTGSGGWPLTIIMTPDQQPFFAATYLPKHSHYGRKGLIEISQQIDRLWKNDRTKVITAAKKITQVLQGAQPAGRQEKITNKVFHDAFSSFKERFDKKNGGFGQAPKFPSPQNLLYLLSYWQASKNQQALTMVESTLSHMSSGGIYDHLGFGFHRYSTDALWRLPHFEKMLYDQALISQALLNTFLATGTKKYAQVADEVLSYVLRDLTSKEGAFFSAEDADSEGEEGKFYLWQENEITKLLSSDHSSIFKRVYNVKQAGNFHEEGSGKLTGANLLFRKGSLDQLARDFSITTSQMKKNLMAARRILFKHRAKRIPPHKDDKILTDWNGMMIAALARGSWILKKPKYLAAAERASQFIWTQMVQQNGQLLHRYRDGEAAIAGFLDDYAFFIFGLIELYQATFDAKYLAQAIKLADISLDQFLDKKRGGFYFNARHGEHLISRQKKIFDGAIPSGNSVMLINLIKLARLTANSAYQQAVQSSLAFFSKQVKQFPAAFPQFLLAAILNQTQFYEIVIAGDPTINETKQLINTIRSVYLPQKVMVLKNTTDPSALLIELLPFTRHHSTIGGKAAVYICENNFCHLPVTGTKELKNRLRQIREKSLLNTTTKK